MKFNKFLLVIIFLILFLCFAAYWQFKSFSGSLSKIALPQIQFPKTDSFLPQDQTTTTKNQFISPDGKLQVEYPADWQPTQENIFSQLTEKTLKKDSTMLFYGQKTNLKQFSTAFLFVQQLNFEQEKNLDDILESIKTESTGTPYRIDVIKWEKAEQTAIFEANYRKEGGSDYFYTKAKILLFGKKPFIVSILTPGKAWPAFEAEANEILNSASLVD